MERRGRVFSSRRGSAPRPESQLSRSLQRFMATPLITWVRSLGSGLGLCDGAGEDLELRPSPRWDAESEYLRLVDGTLLNNIMAIIDGTPSDQTTPQGGNVDGRERLQNLSLLTHNLRTFYQDDLQQLILMTPPNVHLLAYDPLSEEGMQELHKVLLLLLGVAVQSERKEEVIEEIRRLDLDTQAAVAGCIQEVTQNQQNMLSLASLTPGEMESTVSNMAAHLRTLAHQRDETLERLAEVSLDLDRDRRGSPTDGQYLNVQLADAKARARRLRQEVEDTNENLQDCQQELLELRKEYKSLQKKNRELVLEVGRVQADRDEVDALREKAAAADRLRSQVEAYKERLGSMDYYKHQAQEERGSCRALRECVAGLEEELRAARLRCEGLHQTQLENLLLQSALNDMEMERETDKQRIEELLSVNFSLKAEINDRPDEARWRMEPLDLPQGEDTVKPLSCEVGEATLVQLLGLERENRELRRVQEDLRHRCTAAELSTRAEVDGLERERQRLQSELALLGLMKEGGDVSLRKAEDRIVCLLEERSRLQDTLRSLQERRENQVAEIEGGERDRDRPDEALVAAQQAGERLQLPGEGGPAFETQNRALGGSEGKEEARERPSLRDEAGERQSLREEAGERQSLREEAGERQSLRDKASERQSLREEAGERQSLQDKARERQSLRDKAEKGQILREEAGERQSLKDKAEKGQSLQEEAGERQSLQDKDGEMPSLQKKTGEMQDAGEGLRLGEVAQDGHSLQVKAGEEPSLKEEARKGPHLQDKAEERLIQQEQTGEKQSLQDNAREGQEETGERQSLHNKAGERPSLQKEAGERQSLQEEDRERPNVQDNAGGRKSLQNKAGERPSLQKEAGEGLSLQEEAGARPSLQNKAGVRPSLQKEAGEGLSLQNEAGTRPNLQDKAGERPSLQEKAGDGPSLQEEAGARPSLREKAGAGEVGSRESEPDFRGLREEGEGRAGALEKAQGRQRELEQEEGREALARAELDVRRLQRENGRLRQRAEAGQRLQERLGLMEDENARLALEAAQAAEAQQRLREAQAQRDELGCRLQTEEGNNTSLREELRRERGRVRALGQQVERVSLRLRWPRHRQGEAVTSSGEAHPGSQHSGFEQLDQQLDVVLMELGERESQLETARGEVRQSQADNRHMSGQLKQLQEDLERQRSRVNSGISSPVSRGQEEATEDSQGERRDSVPDPMTERLIELERRNAALEADRAALEAAGLRLEGTVERLQEQEAAVHGLCVSLQAQLAGLHARNAQLQVELCLGVSRGEALAGECAEVRCRLSAVEGEMRGALRERDEARGSLEALGIDHERLLHLHQRLEAELEAAIGKHRRLKGRHRDLEGQHRDVEGRYNLLLEARVQSEDLEAALRSQRTALEEEAKNHQGLIQVHQQLKDDYDRLRGVQAERAGQWERLQADLTSSHAQLCSLQLEKARADVELGVLREQMQQLDQRWAQISGHCQLLNQLKGNVEEENRQLGQQVRALTADNRALLEMGAESRDKVMEEQQQYADKLNKLRREKQKLVEKIMDQYRVVDPVMPRRKGNWIADKMKKLIKPRRELNREQLKAHFISPALPLSPSAEIYLAQGDSPAHSPSHGASGTPEAPDPEAEPENREKVVVVVTERIRRKLSSRIYGADSPRNRFRQRRAAWEGEGDGSGRERDPTPDGKETSSDVEMSRGSQRDGVDVGLESGQSEDVSCAD